VTIDVETAVPTGPVSTRFRRWLSVLVGLAALSATVLAWIESDSGRQEEEAFVQASRSSVEIFMKIAASQPRNQFQADELRRGAARQIEASAQVLSSKPGSEAFDLAVALSKVEEQVSPRTLRVVQSMASVPTRAPGVDATTLEALNTQVIDLTPLVESQNAAVDRANRYGTLQERSMFGLALVAIAASLLGLAGLMGATRGGRIALVTAGAALAVALLAGLSGFVV
jgi:hypothetical protein